MCDVTFLIMWDVVEHDGLHGVSPLHPLLIRFRRMLASTLAESDDFICIGFVPNGFVLGVPSELAVFKCLPSLANYVADIICRQFLANIACRSDTERAPTSVFSVKNCRQLTKPPQPHAAEEEEEEGRRNSNCCCCGCCRGDCRCCRGASYRAVLWG